MPEVQQLAAGHLALKEFVGGGHAPQPRPVHHRRQHLRERRALGGERGPPEDDGKGWASAEGHALQQVRLIFC